MYLDSVKKLITSTKTTHSNFLSQLKFKINFI